MTALFWEKVGPYIFGILLTITWWYFGAAFPKNIDALMSASGTVAAVLIGFLGTANAIVLGLTDSSVFKVLKESKYDQLLFRYFHEAELVGILFLIISVIGFFLPDNKPQLWFSVLWVLLGSTAVLLYFRTARLLFKLVKKASI